MATISLRIDDNLKKRLDEVVEHKGWNSSTLYREALSEKLDRIETGNDHRMHFELDLKDRVILATQFELLAKLAKDPDDKEHYEFLSKVLHEGLSWHYYNITQSFSKEMRRERADLVIDIMCMYEDLAYSYQKLKPEEIDGLELSDVIFLGFDGNYEGEELAFANSFRDEGKDRFPTLFGLRTGHNLNSHAPLISLYERQLVVYRKYQPQMPHPFSANIIKSILSA